ncbi:hypothetical protein EDC96DRAFT_559102 [Choanephora cucurbitarum]|nr:hypothetical protein EDC96DRAFT_559102 [Choanephora cucurbitarum]
MKSVRFYLRNKFFDSQYTFELQGHLSYQDLAYTIGTINAAVHDQPPPGNKLIWLMTLCIAWLMALFVHCLFWSYSNDITKYVSVPFFMFFVTFYFIWRYRTLRHRFEYTIIDTCNLINATENIRGIHFRLSKTDPNESKRICRLFVSTKYSIVLEFDDRYNMLSSQQFNRYSSVDFVTVPLNVHVDPLASKIDDKCNSSIWANHKPFYDERYIIQYKH